jgi:hypothetical protein
VSKGQRPVAFDEAEHPDQRVSPDSLWIDSDVGTLKWTAERLDELVLRVSNTAFAPGRPWLGGPGCLRRATATGTMGRRPRSGLMNSLLTPI